MRNWSSVEILPAQTSSILSHGTQCVGSARRPSMRLDGGEVLPGFSVQVGELFELPKRPTANGQRKKNEPRPGKKKGPRRGR